jgi:hypothetical protein
LVEAGPTTVYSEGTKNVLKAMRKANLPNTTRLAVMSANSHDKKTPFFYRKIIKPRLMPLYVDMDKMELYIRGQKSRPASGRAGENDPRRVDFENLSDLTKVRVSADACGLGDQGLGTGLVVRGAAVVKSTIMG